MYNCYTKEGKFFIDMQGNIVEVTEAVYTVVCGLEKEDKNADKTYHHWNRGFDDDCLVSTKYEFMDSMKQESFDHEFCYIDDLRNKIKKICPIDRHILRKKMQGYYDTEIAKEICLSRQAVSYRKKKLRQIFSNDGKN